MPIDINLKKKEYWKLVVFYLGCQRGMFLIFQTFFAFIHLLPSL